MKIKQLKLKSNLEKNYRTKTFLICNNNDNSRNLNIYEIPESPGEPLIELGVSCNNNSLLKAPSAPDIKRYKTWKVASPCARLATRALSSNRT